VIVSDDAIVRSTQVCPRLHVFARPVGHTPLNMEVGLDRGLPRLAPLDRYLPDTHRFVHLLRLSGTEDTPSVTHEQCGAPVLVDRRGEHGKVGREIL